MANSLAQLEKKDINPPHAELSHPLVEITKATGQAMVFHITGMFKPCEDCSKNAVAYSKIIGSRLIFDISSPSTTTLVVKSFDY